jgi:hypothetical protein
MTCGVRVVYMLIMKQRWLRELAYLHRPEIMWPLRACYIASPLSSRDGSASYIHTIWDYNSIVVPDRIIFTSFN